MEALGVAASIIQVAAVGLALAQTLYKFCDEASCSNEQVKDLAFYVRSTSLVLEEIGKVFQDEDRGSRPMVSQNAIVTAKEIVQKCTGTFSDLQEIVDSAEQSALGVFKFTMKASRLKVLQFGLGEMRSNLQCMMQVIIYARLKAEPRRTFDESEQRRLIAELIAQQLRAAEEYNQIESQHAAHHTHQISPSVESSSSHITNGTGTLSASQLPTNNNTNATLSQTEPPKTRPISIRDPGPCPTEPLQFPEQHTSQPPAISTSTTQAKARTVYLDALYMVCCPCLARRHKNRLETASCSQGGLELGLEPPDPRRMGPAASIAELSGESDVDRLVKMWTTLYD